MSAISALEIAADAARARGVRLSPDKRTDYRMGQYDGLTYSVIGAAMRVHNRLGPGLKEAMYQRALSQELSQAGIPHVSEQAVEMNTDSGFIGLLYLDHLVGEAVVVEEKAFSHMLTQEEVAQVITYLCATGKPVGLLINFGRRRLEYKRIFPPKNIAPWRERIRRYVWIPPDMRSVNPFPQSVDRNIQR
jgi:GxxExxY protein